MFNQAGVLHLRGGCGASGADKFASMGLEAPSVPSFMAATHKRLSIYVFNLTPALTVTLSH